MRPTRQLDHAPYIKRLNSAQEQCFERLAHADRNTDLRGLQEECRRFGSSLRTEPASRELSFQSCFPIRASDPLTRGGGGGGGGGAGGGGPPPPPADSRPPTPDPRPRNPGTMRDPEAL
jgi:hypothetical protein